MASPKNWEKVRNNRHENSGGGVYVWNQVWRNGLFEIRLQLPSPEGGGVGAAGSGNIEVMHDDDDGMSIAGVNAYANESITGTEDVLRKAVVKWMRNHPRPKKSRITSQNLQEFFEQETGNEAYQIA